MDRPFLGVEIEIVWCDPDLVQLEVRGANGRFSGATLFYAGHDDLRQLADDLAGFPSTLDDKRELSLGALDPEQLGGSATFLFECVDAVGHAQVAVSLRTDPRMARTHGPESVTLLVPIEAVAVDDFVAQAKCLPLRKGAVAQLRAAT